MISSSYEFKPVDPSRRYKGLFVVVALHALLIYALVTGLARDALKLVKKPLEAAVIQEVVIPPPPPPPPKEIKPPEPQAPKVEAPPPPFVPPPDVPATSTAPAIVATVAPPPAPPVIAPPPPPAPPAKVAGPVSIGVACPTQVKPEMPRKALQEGISGVVRAEAVIVNGKVTDVNILSGPRIYHQAVKAAMMQYKCTSEGEVRATQEFNFKLDD
jgi:protein TonB